MSDLVEFVLHFVDLVNDASHARNFAVCVANEVPGSIVACLDGSFGLGIELDTDVNGLSSESQSLAERPKSDAQAWVGAIASW